MKVSLRPTIKKTFIFASKNRPSFRYSFSGYFLKIVNKKNVDFIFSKKQEKKDVSASDVFLIHNSKNDPISDVSRVTYLVHDAAEGANYFYHLGSEV